MHPLVARLLIQRGGRAGLSSWCAEPGADVDAARRHGSSSWQNLLKSPSKHRQRSRQPHQHSHPAMADAALAAPFAAAAGPVRTPLALVAPGPTAANIFEAAPSPALEKKQQPSTSSSDALAIATAAAATKTKHIVVSATTTSSKPGGSIFRSPGKVGLDKAATAKSPIQDHGGHCRRTSAADEQQLSDKENTSNAAPAPARPSSRQVSTQSSKANARGSKLPFAPPSPAARNALSASLRSPGRAVLGSSASRLQQPRTGSSVSASRPASPTPRPATRSKPASLRSPSAKSSGSNTPIKVVDDVFMLGNACKQGQDRHVAGNENRAAPAEATAATAIDSQDGSDHNNGEEMEEEEEEEDDDGEVADILLGYTSTGSSRTPASASRTIRPNPNAAADTTKQLPSLPAQVQPPAADPDAKVTLTSLHTSPPRPAKSPARPSPTPAKDVKAPTASAAPPSRMQLPGSPVRSVAKAVSRLQQQAQASTAVQPTSAPTQQQHASPRPAPRNMSNLASIASVLGSPVKHASRQQQVQQQNDSPAKTAHAHAIPTSVIQAARKLGLSRPGSPVSASAYAPAAALASSQPTRGATPMAYSSSGGSPTRVPVPRSDAAASPQGEHPPSTAKVAAAQTQAPRVRSPLMSDKISYFQSQSQTDLATTAAAAAALARPISPPTRMSSRLAALSSPATSPKIGGIATAFGGTRQTGQPTALSPRVGARAAATAVSTSSVGGMPKSPRMHGAIAFSGQETVRTGAGRQVGAKHEQHEAETADKSPEDLQAVNVATSSAAQSPPQPQPHKRPDLSPVQSPRSIPVPTARANAISPPPAKSPLRKQGRDDTTTPSVEAGTKNAERELKEQMQGASSRAVKALDYAETDAPPPAETDANGSEYQTSNRNAASAAAAVELPRAGAVVTNTCDTFVPLKSSTQTHQSSQLGQSARQPSVEVPPSPIFSSFLSNPNRTSALSFVGLPGRASIQHQGAASNGSMTGQPQPHSREKSIGLGLGLGLGLGKSLSAANAARAGREQHHQQQDSDSQGSASNERQSFFSAAGSLSGKKRLSSVLADQPESQSSTASGFPGTSKAAKLDAHTSASAIARASISQTSSSSAPPSKEDATKAKLDMLRNRISSFKGTNATNRVSSVSSAMQIYPARLSTAQLVSEKTTIAGASPALPAVVAPSSPPVATTVPPQAIVEVGAGTSAVQIDAAVPAPSAHHTFSSAISAFVPAPSFSASFASLFGASLSKPLQPPSSPVHREQKRDDVASHAHPKHQLQSQSASISMAQTPMYPALPSMTNLAMCLSPPKDQRRVSREPDDDAMEELIQLAPVKPVANTCAVPAAAEAPAVSTHSRRSSTSSVQSIVDAFEAKTTEALEAQERARSTSPVQQKRALAGIEASAAPACTEKAAKRSTTPPFSPPIASRMLTTSVISVTSTHTRVSLIPFTDDTAGDLGALDVADPNVEPIASVRESSPLLPTENNEDELGTDDARFGDGAGVEHAVASQTLHAVQTQKPSVPLGASRSGAAPATSLVKPTTGAGASFKPSRPNPESMDSIKMVSRPPSQQAQHRPPSRAPSVSSLAPSRTSTVSAASISKKTGLASSVNGKGELKSLQLAAAAAKRVRVPLRTPLE